MSRPNASPAEAARGSATDSYGSPFGLFAVLGFAVLAAVYVGASFVPIGTAAQFLMSELAYLLPLSTAMAAAFVAHRRSLGSESRFWLLFAAVNAVILVSELYYIWWMVSVGSPPPPVYAPFQILHLAAAGFFFSLLVSMTKFQNATTTQKVRYGLDLIAVMTVGYVLMHTLAIEPLLADVPGVTPAERLAASAYPMWGLVVMAGSATTLLGFKMSRWRPWERFFTVSLVIYALGIASWPLWLITFKTEGAHYERSVLDLVLILGNYLLALATISRLTRSGQAWPLRPMPVMQPARRTALSYVIPAVATTAMPVFVYLATVSPSGSLDRAVFTVAGVVLALVAVARTALVAVESGRLFHHAVTDPLTGLFNHRFFHERLAIELDAAIRYDEAVSVIVMDIDDFDAVNNVHGHPAGDQVLRDVAEALRSVCREQDAVCRVGGDEFGIILPSTTCSDAVVVALRIQDRLRRLGADGADSLSISAGVVCHPVHQGDAKELVRLADGASYWAKNNGKDQVTVYDPDIVTALSPQDRIRGIEEQTNIGTVRALAAAVDARDPDTQYHSRNVAGLAVQVARELGLTDERVRLLEAAALLHDIGKIGIADDVLGKPGPLTQEELDHVREHPELGERILGSTTMESVLPWIRHHHERWDGDGYPDGLRAVAIPLEARVLAVCDAYDAMVSPRPHRPARARDEAVQELISGMGGQFDPAVVEVFLKMLGHEISAAPERVDTGDASRPSR